MTTHAGEPKNYVNTAVIPPARMLKISPTVAPLPHFWHRVSVKSRPLCPEGKVAGTTIVCYFFIMYVCNREGAYALPRV